MALPISSSFTQGDRHRSHIGSGLWSYCNRLAAAMRPYADAGRKAGAGHIGLNIGTGGVAGNASGHGMRRLAPTAGNAAATGHDIGGDVQTVAGAGAT